MPAPTPAQIAALGHVAALIRRELEARKMSVADLHRAIGEDVKSTRAYAWINSRSRITDQFRPKVAKALGVKEEDLMPRALTQAVTVMPVSDAKLRAVQAAQGAPARTLTAAGDVLAFSVNAEGNARLRLDVTLPLATAAPLLRMLLDAGIVMGGEQGG
jgi:hypothetical protein